MKFLGSKIHHLVKLSFCAAIGMHLAPGAATAEQRRSGNGDFRSVMLEKHNAERQRYNYQALKWDKGLAADAQRWADSLAQKNRFEHAFDEIRKKKQGENLWMGTAGYFSFDSMAQMWLDEKRLAKNGVFPDIAKSGNWAEVGHYTQMIWPKTKKLGCAVANIKDNDFLVCRYHPAGNVIGTKMTFR